jgi:rRNA processing protein Gar1
VQFTEDCIDPEFSLSGATQTLGSAGFTENYALSAASFWEQQVAKEMLHPLAASSGRVTKKYMRVLHSHRFTIQPRLTNEPDSIVTGHSRILNITWNANRICQYDEHNTGTYNLNVPVPGAYAQQIGQVSDFVQPRAKVYLMIKATSLSQLTVGAASPTVTPSYDIVLRKQQITLH